MEKFNGIISPTGHILLPYQTKGGNDYELPRKQVHRVYRSAVCLSLRERELLLSGPDPGGHPRNESHRESVHRLQVLPQKVSFFAAASAAAIFLDESRQNKYDYLYFVRQMYIFFS